MTAAIVLKTRRTRFLRGDKRSAALRGRPRAERFLGTLCAGHKVRFRRGLHAYRGCV